MERQDIVTTLCVVLRVILAECMLWAFVDKLFGLGYATPAGMGMIDGGSPSGMVVYVADGIFKDFWVSIGGNLAIDYLMMLGLIAIGIGLLFGLASRITCISFSVFLLLMFSLALPPSDNPFMDYHITWLVGLWIIYFAGGFQKYSLADKWSKLPIVRDCKWLQ